MVEPLPVLDRFSLYCLPQRVQKLVSEVPRASAAVSNFGTKMNFFTLSALNVLLSLSTNVLVLCFAVFLL